MASIVSKLRTIVLSNIHGLLDATIDMNSVEAIRQHVRDLEAAKEQLADEATVAKAAVTSKEKEVSDLRVKMQTTNDNIELILSDADATNDHLAEPLEARLIGFEQALATKEQELIEAQALANDLAEAARKVGEKHREMFSQLGRLESLERSTRAKEKAAEAVNRAGKLAESADGASVDNVTSRLEQGATVADARLERALGSMSDSVDIGVVGAQAKQRIAARRAKLTGETEKPA